MKPFVLAVFCAAVLFAILFALNALRIALRALRREPLDALAGRLGSGEQYVAIDGIADVFLRTLISLEDTLFYSHRGFDLKGIRHAAAVNVRERRSKERMRGGSTITQQLVKNVYLSPEKTFTRKLAELYISVRMEKTLSKDKILEMYCNAIYYGRNCFGIAQAAGEFFGCAPSELTLNRSLALVCRLPNPDLFDPETSPDLFAKVRSNSIKKLISNSMITEETAALLEQSRWNDAAPQITAEEGAQD